MQRRRQSAVVACVIAAVVFAVLAVALPWHGHSKRKGTGTDPLAGVTLREQAATRDIAIGVGANSQRLLDPRYQQLIGSNFNSITDTNAFKWDVTEPRPGEFNFTAADRVVSVAERYHLRVRGHTLIWHNQNPSWLTQGHWTKAALKAVMKRHIMSVVGRYRGLVAQWDVVNEALTTAKPSGRYVLRSDLWEKVIGPEYVADAFIWAHEADPSAQLFYNDYGAEAPSRRFDAEYRMVARLKAAGVPINGVGLQMHRPVPKAPPYYPTKAQVSTVLRQFADIGVHTEITEMDQPLPLPPQPAQLGLQASLFEQMTAACLSVQLCGGVTIWGADDSDRYPVLIKRDLGAATLFTTSGQPKLAYRGVLAALIKAPGPLAQARGEPQTVP